MNAQTIGWTLIHSLWQGLAIYISLRILLRVTNNAGVRYGLGVGALALMVVCSVATCFNLDTSAVSGGYELVLNVTSTSTQSSTISGWVNENIIWFIRFWMLGLAVGLLRIAAGLWYINRLRANSNPVQEEWMDLLKSLSDNLKVNRVVAMAEAGISSPMVVGFLKPVILFPVGLLAGLSTEQVETILLHELSHIRRQDYIINLVQSVIETIFFFNPFALLISSLIREERENCCDDMVIAKGISPISYVKTLAQLEASRSSSTLALGFAGNQNQLLNRIKRIMENSAKNDWGKSRLIPVALLFLGMVCASWLSISSEKEIEANHEVLIADTSREDGLVVIKRGKGYDNWVVEPLEPMEPDFEMPPIPEFEGIPEFPPVPEFDFEEFAQWDSIPGFHFDIRDAEDWEKFEHEFVDLADFARMHGIEAQKHVMDADMILEMQRTQRDIINDMLEEQNFLLEDMTRKSDAYNEELIDMLAQDGYMKKSESVGDLHIQDFNGEMTINGKKIKEKDALKYRALRDTYFQEPQFRKREFQGRNE